MKIKLAYSLLLSFITLFSPTSSKPLHPFSQETDNSDEEDNEQEDNNKKVQFGTYIVFGLFLVVSIGVIFLGHQQEKSSHARRKQIK